MEKKVILIVDDIEDVREIIEASLSNIKNTSILQAESGNAAFSILRDDHVDLIISDIAMPDGNGFELISKYDAARLI